MEVDIKEESSIELDIKQEPLEEPRVDNGELDLGNVSAGFHIDQHNDNQIADGGTRPSCANCGRVRNPDWQNCAHPVTKAPVCPPCYNYWFRYKKNRPQSLEIQRIEKSRWVSGVGVKRKHGTTIVSDDDEEYSPVESDSPARINRSGKDPGGKQCSNCEISIPGKNSASVWRKTPNGKGVWCEACRAYWWRSGDRRPARLFNRLAPIAEASEGSVPPAPKNLQQPQTSAPRRRAVKSFGGQKIVVRGRATADTQTLKPRQRSDNHVGEEPSVELLPGLEEMLNSDSKQPGDDDTSTSRYFSPIIQRQQTTPPTYANGEGIKGVDELQSPDNDGHDMDGPISTPHERDQIPLETRMGDDLVDTSIRAGKSTRTAQVISTQVSSGPIYERKREQPKSATPQAPQQSVPPQTSTPLIAPDKYTIMPVESTPDEQLLVSTEARIEHDNASLPSALVAKLENKTRPNSPAPQHPLPITHLHENTASLPIPSPLSVPDVLHPPKRISDIITKLKSDISSIGEITSMASDDDLTLKQIADKQVIELEEKLAKIRVHYLRIEEKIEALSQPEGKKEALLEANVKSCVTALEIS